VYCFWCAVQCAAGFFTFLGRSGMPDLAINGVGGIAWRFRDGCRPAVARICVVEMQCFVSHTALQELNVLELVLRGENMTPSRHGKSYDMSLCDGFKRRNVNKCFLKEQNETWLQILTRSLKCLKCLQWFVLSASMYPHEPCIILFILAGELF
jgi:hypothetical protein